MTSLSVSRNASKLPVKVTGLDDGTTRGKAYIPGYQGFIPSNVRNPSVVSQALGKNVREASDKIIMTEIYSHNIPGYEGYQPTDSTNDKGPRQLTSSTVYGSDFAVRNTNMEN
ncbi:hypothetical protein Pmar_PMAR006885 [Perkinsus marinus ATCC 50983]|uniref:Uncharacterized protein n=1 Tax=Perkinsus marinus (strain ATCC 50983 / TXsc) TaxID=423536 RepID=C5K6R9_PERM5|nr:hypothetical protein Pmar_PMAR006885 [Perkinsus marinus ATCC 50983]EER19989.1 hypothetical protein Pmar_PMAR006885 [Perkinsus marinus ATCC 50983]|eukprot:XP_002788193.1 hypothetical protein Pmar_PMAR006885 [Perkinsus marinus ATCC 50983]